MAGDVCLLPSIPDFSALFDKASNLLDRLFALGYLLFIIVLVLVGGLILANILAARRRG
jgi:hypothetical protein